MRKLKRVVPCALALMMTVQGTYPVVPVSAATTKQVSQSVSQKNVLSKKAYEEALHKIEKTDQKTGSTKTFSTKESSSLKRASVKADADAKEGEVGYQFTQDQYVDETHRIRYKYLIIADGEVSAQYIDGIIYENGEPSVTINNKDETYDVTDQLTYPTSVTLNGKTYKVTEAKTSYVRAKQLIIPEGIETCQVLSSSPYVEHMTLPSTIKKINGGELYEVKSWDEADYELSLKKKQVFKGYTLTNPEKAKYISVKDGIIYNKDQTELLAKVPACLEKDTVTLPDTLKELPSSAFQSNLTVKNVIFGKNITAVKSGAFSYSDIQNVTMSNNVTTLDAYAFYYCKKLEKVQLSTGITELSGDYIFGSTSSLKTINLGNIKKITGELVFSYSGIEEADLSNAENMNGRQAFLDCWNLKTVYIGKNTDFTGQKHYGSYLSIGVNPFLGCSGIEKFVEKEKNQNHLYVEDGKLYTSEIEGGLFEADSKDYVSRTYKGKILLGYPAQMQKKDAKNGILTLPKDVTAIGGDGGLTSYGEYRKDGKIVTERYYNKLVIPSNIQAMDGIMVLPQDDMQFDIYTNKVIPMGLIYSQSNYEIGDDEGVHATKTLKFKNKELADDFESRWKDHVVKSYDGETVETGVLPQKHTTSISFKTSSETLKCNGKSQELHLFTELSSDDCTDIVKYTSSNEELARVDENGVVTIKSEQHGKTTITATAGNYSATCDVTLKGNHGLYASGVEDGTNLGTIELDLRKPNFREIADQLRFVKCVDCEGSNHTLTEGVDYKIEYSNYETSGTATATIKGIGVFEGLERSYPFTVKVKQHGTSGYSLSNFKSLDWTGKPLEQGDDLKASCKDCGAELKKGTDYRLEYSNNTDPGTATMKVIGLGEFKGYDQEFHFNIIEDCGWRGMKVDGLTNGQSLGNFDWDENGVRPDPGTIRCDHCGIALEEGKDYRIEYSDNTEPKSTGTVKIIGINRFKGHELTFTFTIGCKGFYSSKGEDRTDLGTYTWTGKAITPDVGTIYDTVSKKALKEGSDYKVVYSDNVEEGIAQATVSGLGDYEGYQMVFYYHIEKQCGWNGFYAEYFKDGDDIGEYGWNENGVTPYFGTINCSHCGIVLEEGVDYKVEYSNNTKAASTATGKIIGINRFKGYELTFKFRIAPKNFYSEKGNGAYLGTYAWTGKAVTPDVGTIYDTASNKILAEGVDYKVVYSDNVDEGYASAQVIGLGDYEGSKLTFDFRVEKQCGWNGFYVQDHKDQEDLGTFHWSGESVEPDLIVCCSHCDRTLIEGEDYTITYSDKEHKEPGKVTITVTGIHDFKGYQQTFTYTIAKKTFFVEGHGNDDLLGEMNYTGNEILYPVGPVKNSLGETLKEGTDYRLIYSDNVKAGTASVRVVGINDYEGCELHFTFDIVDHCGESGFRSNLYFDGETMDDTYDYTGKAITPNPGVITCDYCGQALIEGTDYKVEYSDNIDPGTATMKVVGLGRYKDHTMTVHFQINSRKFYLKGHSNAENLGTYKWTGKAVTPDLGTIYASHNDQALKEGTDYKLVYSDNVEEGTATVKVIGINDYEGYSLTFLYTIEKQCGWNGFYAKGHKDGDSLGTFKWTGNSILVDPDMYCSHCDRELQENQDYKVKYENNIDPGTATMHVIGMGDFEGYELTFTFTIEKKDQATTGDQRPTTTTTETKPSTSKPTTTATTEVKPTTSTSKPTTTTTETRPTTASTSHPTTTTTEAKPTTTEARPTTSTSKPTTTTTETKPTTSTSRPTTTTTETKPTTTETRPTTSTSKPSTTTETRPSTTETKPEKKKLTAVSGITDAVYTGKKITRKIIVRSGKTVLKEKKDYLVSYSSNKDCGIATVKIVGTGTYQGTITKTFKILPKKASILKLLAAKRSAIVQFFKNDGNVTGYQISYSYDKKFKGQKYKELKKVKYKNIKIKRKKYLYASDTIKALKSKKYVYVKIRAYKQVGKTKIYGSWSSSKKVKIK